MIVLNTKESAPVEHKAEKIHKESFEDMFRKEIDAYCAYKEWYEETDDHILELALEEIMIDEYLHAKFLRDYMMDRDMYTLTAEDPHEKKFHAIQRKIFDD